MKRIYLLLAPLLLTAEIELGDIEVEASTETNEVDFLIQKESFLKKAPMQKQITAKDAVQIAGTNGDPLKALKSFAGVVSTNNDSGGDIFIHGSKPRETRFTINQLPISYVFHAGGLHSVIAPEATAQIDAYLGGFDTTYDAMGAVVDITPKYPTGSNNGRIHLGMYDADFAYDAKLGEDTSLFLSGRRSYFDLFASKILNSLDEDKKDSTKKTTFTLFPQYYDAQMILSHNIGNSTFSLEAITAQDEMKLNTTMNKTRDPAANGKINAKYGFTTIGGRWNYIGDNFESMTLLSHMKTKENNEFFDADFYVKSSISEKKLYHETILDVENHKPLIGFEFKEINAPIDVYATDSPSGEDFDPLVSDQERIRLNKTFNAKRSALFVQDIWDITPNDHFRYGVRAWDTDFQKFGSGIDPRVAWVHEFSDGWSGSLAIGRYSQLPELSYIIDGFGNPLIEASEFSNHYAFNVTKKFDAHSSLMIEPYYKSFHNLAIADTKSNYEAVGKGEAYGVDITYKKKIDKLNIMAAYTYVKAKRQLNTNNTRQYRFQGDIPHTLQVSTSYTFNNDLRLSSLFRFNSGRPFTPIVGTEDGSYKGQAYKRPIYGDPYSQRMPSNFDLDIQIGKTYHYGEESFEFAIEFMNVNALFKENIDSYRYNDNYERDGEYKQMGFLPAFHLTYRF